VTFEFCKFTYTTCLTPRSTVKLKKDEDKLNLAP
jgi:hypothetical protein